MPTLLADLRYGLRLLRQAPGFTLIAICALALGIGANTAIFSTLDAVVLRPLPYEDPDRVMMVFEDASFIGFAHNTPAPANYIDWREQNHVFTDMAATRNRSVSIIGDGSPEQLYGLAVTPNFLSVLGVRPLMGRMFTEKEDRNAAPVVLISYGLWQRRYAGAASVLDRTILLNDARYTVVGVMPRDFVYRDRERDFWFPINVTPKFRALRDSHYLSVVARLKPGATVQQASEEMHAIGKRLEQQYPNSDRFTGVVVVPIKEDLLGKTRTALLVLMAAAGCVLLIACANLASLLLARAVARKRELAVRAALGAGRGRLIRQMVTEGALLSLAGGALGLGLSLAGMRILEGLVPLGLPSTARPTVDLRLLAFTLLLSLITGVVFSIVPAFQAAHASVNEALKQGGRSGADVRGRATRDALVVLEVAAALVLLTGAGLMIQTMAKLRAVDLGFRADHLLTIRTALGPKYNDFAKRLDYYQRVLGQTAALPGVESAAFGSTLPFQSIGNTRGYKIEGLPPDLNFSPDALFRNGTSTYLQTLGVKLREGRLFDGSETAASPPVVIINETFARHFWPKESALGHRVSVDYPNPVWRTVIAVVEDVQERGYDLWMKPGIYLPAEQVGGDTADYLVVRTKNQPASLIPAVRRVIAAADPEQPISNVQTMDEIIADKVADRQQQMTLLGAFAGLALVLASIGLYGVLSYAVTQRSREIGLRMALGASAASMTRLVVGQGIALTGAGLLIGLLGACAATRALKNLLYGVSTTDPLTFAAVAALLTLISLAACWIPARRASRLDPIVVLREE
ncbi:MAG: ABC transporter permease [Bryobacteraceae bacterium]|jgi:putative ABC transport system permease protein